jgi:hypothetical protein
MNWNSHMEGHYMNPSYPYNSAGSFIEYFEGLTYDHVNFIFNGGSHAQVPFICKFCIQNLQIGICFEQYLDP